MPTGNLAAKLAAEGTDTDMDIFYDLDFSYAGLVEQYLADVSSYDQSIYVDDCNIGGRFDWDTVYHMIHDHLDYYQIIREEKRKAQQQLQEMEEQQPKKKKRRWFGF